MVIKKDKKTYDHFCYVFVAFFSDYFITGYEYSKNKKNNFNFLNLKTKNAKTLQTMPTWPPRQFQQSEEMS